MVKNNEEQYLFLFLFFLVPYIGPFLKASWTVILHSLDIPTHSGGDRVFTWLQTVHIFQQIPVDEQDENLQQKEW